MRKCAGSEAIKALESVPAVQEHISLTCICGANADNPGVPGLLQQLLRVVVSAGVLLTFPGPFAGVARGGEWLARTWQTDEGLPDNRVTGVAQSPDGYLWVATHGGLMRFNGAQFEEFSLVHLPGVANRLVRKLYLDRRNRFWLVMDRGEVVRVDEHAARVFTLADGVPTSRVTAVAEDEHGDVWLAGGQTVCRIAGDTVSTFTAGDGLPPGRSTWLTTDVQGRLWFARGAQLGVVRDGQWQTLRRLEVAPLRLCAARTGGVWACGGDQVHKLNAAGEVEAQISLPKRVNARELLEDQHGALWIGTATDGLLRLQGREVEAVPSTHTEVNGLAEDREGNLWVGTGGNGLVLLRPRAVRMLGVADGLPLESVRTVCQDTAGRIWIVLQNGRLACRREDQWTVVSPPDRWPGDNFICATAGRDGRLWVGTRDRGLLQWTDGQWREWGNPHPSAGGGVRALLAARNGDLWMAMDSPSRLYRLRAGKFQTWTPPGEVRVLRTLTEDADSRIWAGSSDGQILRVEGDVLVAEAAIREPRLWSVRALHGSADGSLWIGYAGWGVGWFARGQYARITTAAGLFDDYPSQILSDDRGGVWFTSNRGLFQVHAEELAAVAGGRVERVRAMVYGRSDGLPGFQSAFESSPSTWRGMDGRLWFATLNGLLTVQPDRIQDNPTPPPVTLEKVWVDDRLVALRDSHSPLRPAAETNLLDLKKTGGELPLSPRHRKVEFEFAALSFTSPENVHFRYRLEDFDQDWVEAGTQRAAKYPRLPPGRYAFRVRACNNAGVWNETGVHLNLLVPPFYWQTWWFRLGVLVLFTGTVAGVVRYFSFQRLRARLQKLERQAELQRERGRIARDMHDEVGAKLSRLSLLSDLASQQGNLPTAARQEVTEISETARDTIRSFEEIVWAVNPKNDSLPDLVHYLCRYAEEFLEGSGVQCTCDLPDEIPPLPLPTELRHHVFLAAKEALNNVLKHAAAQQVCVRLRLGTAAFEIVIEDDGRGFASGESARRSGGGNGLHNMQHRMQAVGGSLAVESQPQKGTRVTLCVPCRELNPA